VIEFGLEQVLPLLPFGEPETLGGPSLLLWEKSGHRIRLSGVKAEQVDTSAGINEPTTATITFNPPSEVDPGSIAHAPVVLSEVFPLGTTKGTASVSSPQLSEPLAISFEVRARRHKATIIVFLILGLLAVLCCERGPNAHRAASGTAEGLKVCPHSQRRATAPPRRGISQAHPAGSRSPGKQRGRIGG